MKNKKTTGYINAALAFTLLVATGCSDSNDGSSSANTSISAQTSISDIVAVTGDDNYDEDEEEDPFKPALSDSFDNVSAEISFNGNKAAIDGNGAVFNDSILTISQEGIYHISGNLDNGQIIVDSQGQVQLILDGASVSCSNSAPLYIKNSKKTFITLAKDSENILTDGKEYADSSENEPDAAVFSHDSIILNGSGSLTINANYNEGITSKDDITITGGTINITSPGNGIKGKDFVTICGGTLNIEAGSDGIKSSNTSDSSMGFVYIKDGTVNITSAEDGIQAENQFSCDGGTINIVSGGGSASAQPKKNDDFGGMKGHGGFGKGNLQDTEPPQQLAQDSSQEEDSISAKGIKSGTVMYVNGGTFNIDSADDGLHSNGDAQINGGNFTISSGNKGIHGDSSVHIIDGNINIEKSYEGIESTVISISGGNIEIQSSDDGFNASDGSQEGSAGENINNISLDISGGIIYVNAQGDGLDSNGALNISGGTVLVDGPENGGNGALDGNGKITVSGGILAAAGSSQMAEYPDNSSEQRSVSIGLDGYQTAGTLITICDGNKQPVISYAPAKTFDHIVLSSPDLKKGETYTIYIGGSFDGDSDHGLVTGYKGDGNLLSSFTAEDATSIVGNQSSMGGGFDVRHDFQMPTNESGKPDMPGDPPEPPNGDFGNKPPMDGFPPDNFS